MNPNSDEYDCCKQRSLLYRLVRKAGMLVVISIVAFLYFITCLLINFAQLVNFLLFQYTFPSLRRHINWYLQELILSQNTILLEWNCKIRFRLFFADEETKAKWGKEHSLVIGNHHFQLDGLFYWMTGEMTNSLGASKAYAKSELLYMPIIGWVFYFGEFIFLKRDWRNDAKSIGPSLDTLMKSPYPMLLLILPEGTRFTPEKYAAGMAYAKEHGLDVKLKHHLLPRVKGFANSLRHLQSNYKGSFGLYHIQVLSRSTEGAGAFEPTLTNFFAGKPMKVDCYIERISNEKLPAAEASDEEQAKFLYDAFEHKDKLIESHREHHRFPTSLMTVKKRSMWLFARFLLLNFLLSGSIVFSLLYTAFTTSSFPLRCTIFGLIILVYAGIFLIINLLQNSQYGAKKSNKAGGKQSMKNNGTTTTATKNGGFAKNN